MTPMSQPLSARLATRASISLMLDLVKIGRVGRNINDGLIALTVIQANTGPVNRDPVLQRTYATLDTPPPNELRRPVSVSAVANSLRLPYETVRRRIAAMAEMGLCEITSKGVVAPTAVLATPMHRAVLEYNSTCVEAFYNELREIGFLSPPARGFERFPPDDPPLRAIARISADYALRILEYFTRRVGDLTQCLIFMEVLRSNIEGFSNDDRGFDARGRLGFLPDERRKAISVSALATKLAIPAETVRRHVAHLIAAERIVRTPTGLIVPVEQFLRPEIADIMRDNCAFVQRMFAGLAPLGVLLDWEARRDARVQSQGQAMQPAALAVGL